MSKLIEFIKFGDLRASRALQVRVELNKEALEDYTNIAKECKAAGADHPFPAGIVYRNKDGNHLAAGYTRRAALKEAGYEGMDFEVREGDARDAWLAGVLDNSQHGSRLTNKDKKHILATALEDDELVKLSSNGLAKKLGLSLNFVLSHRPKNKTPGEVETVRKSGKKGKVKTANIGKKGGKKAAKPKKEKTGKAAEKQKESVSKMVNKIAVGVGGKDGEKIRTALNTGALNLPISELKRFSETSAARIAKIAPLVTNLQMSVKEAIKTIDKVIGPKDKFETAILAAIAGGGFTHEKIEGEKFKFVVYEPSQFDVEITPKSEPSQFDVEITPKS